MAKRQSDANQSPEVQTQGALVRKLKESKAPQQEIDKAVKKLIAMKAEEAPENEECKTNPTASEVYKEHLKVHLERLRGRASCCHLSVFDSDLNTLEKDLANPHLLAQIDSRYMAKKASAGFHWRWILHCIHDNLKMGIVESLESVFYALDNVLLFPHTHMPSSVKARLEKLSNERNRDVFDLLELFCDISQILDDAKVRDIVWFHVLSCFGALSQHIFTTEPLDQWPVMLRNSKAHNQVFCAFFLNCLKQARLVGFVLTAMNITELKSPGMKPKVNWELSIEVNDLTRWLSKMLKEVYYLVFEQNYYSSIVRAALPPPGPANLGPNPARPSFCAETPTSGAGMVDPRSSLSVDGALGTITPEPTVNTPDPVEPSTEPTTSFHPTQ